jgi:hypothetical protein
LKLLNFRQFTFIPKLPLHLELHPTPMKTATCASGDIAISAIDSTSALLSDKSAGPSKPTAVTIDKFVDIDAKASPRQGKIVLQSAAESF